MMTTWIRCHILLCAFMIMPAWSATTADIDTSRSKALAWLVKNQQGDRSWRDSSTGSEPATALAVMAMKRAGMTKSLTFHGAVAHLANRPVVSTDALARSAMAMYGQVTNLSTSMSQLLQARKDLMLDSVSIGYYIYSWGAYPQNAPSVIDTALALEAFKLTGTTLANSSTTLNYFYSVTPGLKNSDGGWPYAKQSSTSSTSQVIPTAHALRVLVRYRSSTVDTYINGAIDWLIARQNTTSGGYNPEGSTSATADPGTSALVLQALAYAREVCVSGTGCYAKANTTATATFNALQDYLIGTQSTDGSWGKSAMVTALAVNAWPSSVLTDTDKDGMPNSVETFLYTNPNVADAHYYGVKNNSLGRYGSEYASALNYATLSQNYSEQLTIPNVTPTSWSIVSGSLPYGLELNTSTGLITGVPGNMGLFHFIYVATTASGDSYSVVAELTVQDNWSSNSLIATTETLNSAQTFIPSSTELNNISPNSSSGINSASANSEDIPTLPEWGLMMLGVWLVRIVKKYQKV